MREESLLCQLRRRFVPTTDSAHSLKRYPNLLEDTRIDGLDQVWIADITYLRLPTTFCYLAAILDAYSRRCVGWHLSRFIDASLTLSALEMALWSRRPAVGLIHHSDRGVRYASSEYVLRLEEQAGARISMAAVGNPYENAKVESFFWTLKLEEVYLKD
jgi:putative transposase